MIESDSSSEEDICQEFQQMIIVKDKDSNIHEDDEVVENPKLEDIKPEADDDATDFVAERNDAEQVSLLEVDEEEYETRAHAAAEADWLEVEDKAVEEGGGYDDLGEEEAEAIKALEEDGDAEEMYDEDDGDVEEMYDEDEGDVEEMYDEEEGVDDEGEDVHEDEGEEHDDEEHDEDECEDEGEYEDEDDYDNDCDSYNECDYDEDDDYDDDDE